MVTSSVLPQVIDYLVSQLGTAMSPTPVYDGVGLSESGSTTYVMVGAQDPNAPADSEAGTSSFAFAALARGVNPKDESLTVYVTAVAWDGGGVQKTARDAAYTLASAAETSLRGDPSMGSLVLWSLVSATTLHQDQASYGAIAVVTMQITARARLS